MSLERTPSNEVQTESEVGKIVHDWQKTQKTLAEVPAGKQGAFFEAFAGALKEAEQNPDAIKRALAAGMISCAGEGNRAAAEELFRLAGMLAKTERSTQAK